MPKLESEMGELPDILHPRSLGTGNEAEHIITVGETNSSYKNEFQWGGAIALQMLSENFKLKLNSLTEANSFGNISIWLI